MAPPSPPAAAVPDNIHSPQIRLLGEINEAFVERFLDGIAGLGSGEECVVVEVTTHGGDAELGRRLALEVREARERLKRRLVFLGKTEIMSAGVTVMAAFPRADRFLTSDTQLMIHGRQLEKTVELSGPIEGSREQLKAILGQIEIGIELEREGFRELIEGSDVGMDEICARSSHNWYMRAGEALDRRLIAAVI